MPVPGETDRQVLDVLNQSIHLFVRLSVCEGDVLKTSKPVLMPLLSLFQFRQ